MSDAEREWIHKDYYSTYNHTPLLDIQNKPEFFEAFYKIVSGHLDDLTKKSLMIKLIAIITTDNFPKLLQSNTRFNVANQIKDYIDAGNGMGMTLDNFSKIFFYDKFYMERKFKEAFGINLIEYRNKKRMEFAKDLLKIYSVSHVSEMLGYQSIYSFSRAYKSYFGYAPSKNKSVKRL
jgi:AraC-like DNA-binding protein